MKAVILLLALIALLFTIHNSNACSCDKCLCSGNSQCPVPLKQYQAHVRNLTCSAGSHFERLNLYIDSPQQNSSFYYDTYSEVEYNKYVSGKSASSVYSTMFPVACSGLDAKSASISPYNKLFLVISCGTDGGCMARYAITQSCSPDHYLTAKLPKVSFNSGEVFSLDVTFSNVNYSMPVTLSLDDSSVTLNGVSTRQLTDGKVTFSGLSLNSQTSKSSVFIFVKGKYLDTEVIGGGSVSIGGGSTSTGRQNSTIRSFSLSLIVIAIVTMCGLIV